MYYFVLRVIGLAIQFQNKMTENESGYMTQKVYIQTLTIQHLTLPEFCAVKSNKTGSFETITANPHVISSAAPFVKSVNLLELNLALFIVVFFQNRLRKSEFPLTKMESRALVSILGTIFQT